MARSGWLCQLTLSVVAAPTSQWWTCDQHVSIQNSGEPPQYYLSLISSLFNPILSLCFSWTRRFEVFIFIPLANSRFQIARIHGYLCFQRYVMSFTTKHTTILPCLLFLSKVLKSRKYVSFRPTCIPYCTDFFSISLPVPVLCICFV